ncbi:MAG TPA: hypothetical protein VE398_18890 [Acidobacteriota bacterium]|nr:hypothetical protein [Acidobacteriota bacterium]
MKGWDRKRGFVPCATPFPLADLYVCWDPQALYLGVYCVFPEEAGYYRDDRMPDADRTEWIVQIAGDHAPIRIPMGIDADYAAQDIQVKARHGSLTKNAAIVRIPVRRLNGSEGRLAPGQAVRFTATLTTQARAHTMTWRADLKLAGN